MKPAKSSHVIYDLERILIDDYWHANYTQTNLHEVKYYIKAKTYNQLYARLRRFFISELIDYE